MHLVNDIDPVFSLRRWVLNLLTDFTDIFYTIVGCRINLHHVHGTSGQNTPASLTLVARASIDRMFTVDSSRKNLCNRSLSGSSRSAEQIGVTDSLADNLIFQCLYNVILPVNIIKSDRTPFAVKCGV